jgi:hypothetical protein
MSNSKESLGDSRLKKDAASTARGNREGADLDREDTDGTSTSVSERRSTFRDEWTANALPTPPGIPGFHLCWLSTTSSTDPIHKRIRMGYEPVRVEDVPGFEHYKMKSGEYEGMVSCNEMLLFKIPNELYQEMMSYFHHEKPMDDEAMLKESPALRDEQARKIAEKADSDGFTTLGTVRAPKFH